MVRVVVAEIDGLSVDAEAQVRIDYELAAQVGTKQAWDSFLTGHATGYYSNLARAQNDKLTTAQQTRIKADDARRLGAEVGGEN